MNNENVTTVIETYTQTKEEADQIANLATNTGAIYAESVRLPPSKKPFDAPELERDWMVEILCAVDMVPAIRKAIQKAHPDVLPPVSTTNITMSEATVKAIQGLKDSNEP